MKKIAPIVLLGLGANLGDRLDTLRRAVALLVERGAIYAPVCSQVYETAPVGYTEQPAFLNIVVAAGTLLLPEKLLAVCREVETALGRVQREKWHEREIDIDLLLYRNKIIARENFSVPHPAMHQRRFVLVPAVEIVPDMMHPALCRTLAELLAACNDDAAVRAVGHLSDSVPT